MQITTMKSSDIPGAAKVHKLTFTRQLDSVVWLECNVNAVPRTFNFVAKMDDLIIGYIIWTQKSGFRREVVLELEQLAVSPRFQGKGVGKNLITDTLPIIKQQLLQRQCSLKHILVTTRADNYAQQLYKDTLGAEIETTISNLYSSDEVLMIARNIS